MQNRYGKLTSIILVEKRDYKPGRPLWQRVPTRDAEGRYLNDFMMLIPKLSHWPEVRRAQVFEELDRVFAEFEEEGVIDREAGYVSVGPESPVEVMQKLTLD